MTLVYSNINFMRIIAGVPWGEASNNIGVVENGNFQLFRWYFSETEMRPALLCSGFSLIPYAWTWMTVNDYFALNSVFVPVRLAFESKTFENNLLKLIEMDTYFQRRKYSAGTLVSGDIRFMRIFAGSRDSLERRHQTTVESRVNPRAVVACILV